MNKVEDPAEPLIVEEGLDAFDALSGKPLRRLQETALPAAVTARFHGFDLDEQPLVVGVPELPDEIVPARTTVPLLRSDIGCSVILLFEGGDGRRPIVVGVLQQQRQPAEARTMSPAVVSADVDDDRLVLTAEREVVLRCGNASITLTRAGKVIIKGSYILSRSSGHNKIKGAAVDIN